ncbi:MAG: ATP-binding cassette domain-containing protein, partial [Gammaproteobacteria bacterium]|nr:ATP-binding cassette domain-containing protein [Gammaproteobacteria bacterium]
EDEFARLYTGVAFTLEPRPDFVKGGRPPRIRDKLWAWFRPHRGLLLVALVCGLLSAVPTLAVPLLLGVFVDHAYAGALGDALYIVGAVALAAVALFAFTWLQQHALNRLSLRVSVEQSARLVSTLLRLPREYFAQRLAGDVASRVHLVDNVTNEGSTQLTGLFIELVISAALLAWMVYEDAWLATAVLAVAAANAGALHILVGLRLHENHRLRQEQGRLLGVGAMGLQRLESIRASGTEAALFARWTGYLARELGIRQRFAEFGAAIGMFPALAQALGAAVILYIGTIRMLGGEMSLGDLMAYFLVGSRFLVPIGRFVDTADRLNVLAADLQRIDDMVAGHELMPALRQEEQSGQRLAVFQGRLRLAGHLEIKGLTFGYRRYADPLLSDFNLVIEPGQRVAVIGPSGSGKSTLAMLVGGLWEPWAGEILFDGAPREQVPAEVMADSVAFVDQEVALLSGTVRENLTMWNHKVPDDLVVAAARDACIHEEISRRPLNYNSPVHQGGLNFSGGQRQRLEIARALVYKPSLLILDEATSAVDPLVERRIDDAIRRRGCACLVIAHRLSTIRDCDEIIVMDRGRVVQRGRHEALMQDPDNVLYRNLILGE